MGLWSPLDLRILDIVGTRLRTGRLEVALPNGSTRVYRGARPGPVARVRLHDTKLLRRVATLGAIGFEGRWDYAAIGNVTNLAARLCAEAKGGQVLACRKTMAALEGAFQFDAVGPLTLKGFEKPVPAFALKR